MKKLFTILLSITMVFTSFIMPASATDLELSESSNLAVEASYEFDNSIYTEMSDDEVFEAKIAELPESVQDFIITTATEDFVDAAMISYTVEYFIEDVENESLVAISEDEYELIMEIKDESLEFDETIQAYASYFSDELKQEYSINSGTLYLISYMYTSNYQSWFGGVGGEWTDMPTSTYDDIIAVSMPTSGVITSISAMSQKYYSSTNNYVDVDYTSDIFISEDGKGYCCEIDIPSSTSMDTFTLGFIYEIYLSSYTNFSIYYGYSHQNYVSLLFSPTIKLDGGYSMSGFGSLQYSTKSSSVSY